MGRITPYLALLVATLAAGPAFAAGEGAGTAYMPGTTATETQRAERPVAPLGQAIASDTLQSDAFTTAGEQASFLAAYQMSYGPYGTQGPDVEKLKKETASAIDACLSNGNCSEDQKKLVLQALTQYNDTNF